jgi:hypothetical protein
MKTVVDYKSIKDPLNKCYLDYDSEWNYSPARAEIIEAFKCHIEQTAGLKIDFVPEVNNLDICYKLTSIELVDHEKFTMWLLKWS